MFYLHVMFIALNHASISIEPTSYCLFKYKFDVINEIKIITFNILHAQKRDHYLCVLLIHACVCSALAYNHFEKLNAINAIYTL